ncbi:hypothetical protein QQS21_008329 [Conoideocrella luteorostrata]|uniref:Uncharacterized protein n=1 Tax=Conoideocrella luteorostrata TaxID=1105319 RepID=A0AAJ0FYS6_9HYPO|nr:hypothetical protein QQS21_008329 [Conoideocrella luteorostrata]
MAPPLPAPPHTHTRNRNHKRDDYDGPNLGVLIPVIIVLSIFAVIFFGWFGLPWPKIMAWWRRKRSSGGGGSSSTTAKEDDLREHDRELEDRRPSTAREASSGAAEPQPGSGASYAKAMDRSTMDALKLSNLGDGHHRARRAGETRSKTKNKSGGGGGAGQAAAAVTTTITTATTPQGSHHLPGTVTPTDLAPGQLTPGQQSIVSSIVPDRRASPWDPTKTT